MKTNIVVDKCYLEGTSTDRIRDMAKSSRLLVSDSLFYEMLTADEPSRKKCFAKFPPEENPVDLITHVGLLMRLEIDTKAPAGKPSTRRENLDFDFKFNSNLIRDVYVLPPEAVEAINKHTADLRSDVLSYLERSWFQPFFRIFLRIPPKPGLLRLPRPKKQLLHQAHYYRFTAIWNRRPARRLSRLPI